MAFPPLFSFVSITILCRICQFSAISVTAPPSLPTFSSISATILVYILWFVQSRDSNRTRHNEEMAIQERR
ncbi:hypothetical protein Bca4012_063682 [Brassica carinata]